MKGATNMRVELGSGDWVELLDPERSTWADLRAVQQAGAAVIRAGGDQVEQLVAALPRLVRAWHIQDAEGRLLPPPGEDPNALDRVPALKSVKVLRAADAVVGEMVRTAQGGGQ